MLGTGASIGPSGVLTWEQQGAETGQANPLINLVHADLKGLPPATVITAQIDPLRSEGKELADGLKENGAEVDYKNYEGVTHEFFGMGSVVDEARQARQQAADGLKKAFSRETTASQR